MAYIAPNSIIKFCTDVGCESSYTHTIHFTSLANQLSFFNSRVKANSGGYSFTLNSQSYQRFGKNKMRVAIPVEQLYDCSYIMFQNTSYSNKWFFAFITGLEYVNNETSEVTYQLDVIQSFMFKADGTQGWRLSSCFIERQHTNDDTVGSNTVPENLDFGEYMYTEHSLSASENPFNTWYIVVATTFNNDPSLSTASGTILNNVYNGLKFFYFTTNTTGVSTLNTFLGKVTDAQKSDGIVSIFMYPYSLIPLQEFTPSPIINITKNKPTTIPGYGTPKNKKLLTSPFNALYVTDYNGQSAIFPYEFFTTETWSVGFRGSISCAPEIIVYPQSYKGMTQNYNERILISNFPQCAYAIDAYRAWIAMSTNKVNIASGIAMGSLQTAGGIKNIIGSITPTQSLVPTGQASVNTGGMLGGIQQTVAGLSQVASTLASWRDASMMPAQAKSTGNGTGLMGAGAFKVGFYQACLRPEYAKIIDDYFDMYGYATHKVGVPNITCRAGWNYVKTVGCLLGGGIPAFAEEEIASIFDRGITFWHRATRVGDYTQDNSIVTTGGA